MREKFFAYFEKVFPVKSEALYEAFLKDKVTLVLKIRNLRKKTYLLLFGPLFFNSLRNGTFDEGVESFTGIVVAFVKLCGKG